MIRSRTVDRFALGAAVLFGVAAIACVLPWWGAAEGFAVPPLIGLVAFLPLLLTWGMATVSTITVDDQGIAGLIPGRKLLWGDIARARVHRSLLIVEPKAPSLHPLILIRCRPGAPSRALTAALDPVLVPAIERDLAAHLPRP